MVKAELDRDYYADLELAPTASANDIKKQFKKLGQSFSLQRKLSHVTDHVNSLSALQYHPDRNPDSDTTAQFQAIQAANEVLTDPQQRAKYDAQRIRTGLLHTHTGPPPPPPRAAPAQRSPTSNFPPPPKPPPFTGQTKYSPLNTGSQKYARFKMPDPPAGTYRRRDAEEAKSKTNDFKAWSHMRHGQGPLPKTRKETAQPAQPSATASSKPTRQVPRPPDMNGTNARQKTSHRTDWEDLPDAGMPNLRRSNTSRAVPKPNGFSAYSPEAGDESQARSAYFNVSRGERPTSSRTQSNMGPPPAPSAKSKKPDRPPFFASQTANGESFLGGKRTTVPYPAVHGEKTDLKSPGGLHRSSTNATPRDSNSRTGFYDSEPTAGKAYHARAASANAPRTFYEPQKPGFASVSTTTSESSSDEESLSQKEEAANLSRSAFLRPKQVPKSRRPRPGPGAPHRSFFNPHVRAEDAEDEPMAPHSFMSNSTDGGFRRHSHIDIPASGANSIYPEGFKEHRRRHEAEQAFQPSTSAPSGPGSSSRYDAPPSISRPRSFDDHYRRPSQDTSQKTPSGAQPNKVPMYDTDSSPLSSFDSSTSRTSSLQTSCKWSDCWPFNSPKTSQLARKEAPPYWAVPSALPVYPNLQNNKNKIPHSVLLAAHAYQDYIFADDIGNDSFRWGVGDLPRPFAGTPPLRSQSSDQIDVRFSPSGPPPRFKAGGENSPSQSGSTSDNPMEMPYSGRTRDSDPPLTETTSQSPPGQEPLKPPPQGPACFFPKDWHHRFTAGTFQHSPTRSRSRSNSRKRANSVSSKRAGTSRPAGLQPTVDEHQDDPPDYSSVKTSKPDIGGDSRVSSDGSAMDIDPVLTPPSSSDQRPHMNGDQPSPLPPATAKKLWHQGPDLPPRTAIPVPSKPEASNLNMKEFKEAKPFAAGGEGLNDVEDLESSLPHQPAASPTRPVFEKVALPSRLPKPPKAPTPPNKLNHVTWDLYMRDMNRYMSNWNNFNNVMLSHFHARQEVQRQMSTNWMTAQGDGDYFLYLESIIEDKKVHQFWEVALDLHRECIQKLGEARNGMKAEVAKASGL